MRFAKDGYATIALTWGAVAAGMVLWVPSLILLLPVAALVLWFFRDPERVPECGPEGWVSPADGEVVEILSVNHPYTGPATKVGIFMNPLSVHVNRIPRAGTVEYMKYVPGKKWMAFADKASEDNERFYLGFHTDCGPSMVVQIAGFLARRIVSRTRRGCRYDRGQRFGMIKLGSKVDVYLPEGVQLKTSVGQNVFAGKTCIGVCRHERID